METLLQKSKRILIYIIVVTLPVMTYINLFGKIKVNASIADIFIAALAFITFIDFKNFSLNRNFPNWWYFAGLITWSIISNIIACYNQNVVNGSILSTINELIKFAISGLYFYAGYNSFKDRKEFRKILRIWVYTAATVSIIGIFVTINLYMGNIIKDGLFIHSDLGAKRLLSTLTDPNLAAAYLNLSFWIAVAYFNTSESKADRYFSIAACVLIFISLLLTQSRSGLISFVIGLLVFIILRFRNITRYLPIIIPFLFLLYFGILDIDATYFDKNFYNSTVKRFEQIVEGTGEWEIRSNLTKAAYMMGKDNFFFGVGRGNYVNNSKQYYEKIGIDATESGYEWNYGIKIPHNTYVTFFAELGIIGLVLFLLMFYIVLKKSITSRNIFLLAVTITHMVQAYAVNLENFRCIWFALPFALLLNGEQFAANSKSVVNDYKIGRNKLVAICATLIAIAAIVFLDTAPKYSNPVMLSNDSIVAYVDDIEGEGNYILRYFIDAETSIVYKPSSSIRVYAIGIDGERSLVEEILHYSPKGCAYIPFTTPKNACKIVIEANGTLEAEKVMIKDALLASRNTEKAVRLFIDSKYVTNSLEKYLANTIFYRKKVNQDIDSYKLFANTFVSDASGIENLVDHSTVYFKGDKAISISDKILFLGATKEELNENKIKITLKFKCIDEIDKDYSIWFHGGVMDKDILSDSRRQYGFENWDHGFKVKTTEWQVGQIYEDEFEITVKEGQYSLKFGLWNAKIRSNLSPMIYLGWI